MHHHINVIFRSCGLFPRVAILRGVALTPHGILGHGGVRTRTHSLLNEFNLTSGTGRCPSQLSNNRRRQITVIQTLTVRPRLVLFSRVASTLSPLLINRILRSIHRLGRRNVAVLVTARRVTFTHSITSHIYFLSNNIIRRRKAPRRILNGPQRQHAQRFLTHVLKASPPTP